MLLTWAIMLHARGSETLQTFTFRLLRSLIRLAVINTNDYKYGARQTQGGRNKFWKFLILFTLELVIIIPSAFINTGDQDTQIILSRVNFSD